MAKSSRERSALKYNTLIKVIVVLFGLIAMISFAAGGSAPAALLSVERTGNDLTLSVISTGCSKDEDFYLQVHEAGDKLVEVTLIRTRADICKRFPKPMLIERSLPKHAASGIPIRILNPIVTLQSRNPP